MLENRSIQDQYGQAVPAYQNKNVVALTKMKLAVVKPFKYPFAPNPAELINAAFNSVLYDGKDINTALREADEKLSLAIQNFKK